MDRLTDLYVRHAPECLRLAYLLTFDRGVAEDLVQDAFVRVSGRLTHLRSPDAFGRYLRRTVVNLSRNHLRRQRVHRAYLERHGGGEEAVEGPTAASLAVRQALRDLPERQRTAIVLRFWLDVPEAEAAEILRCRPGTFRSLVSRGMQSLRIAIGETDE